MKLQQLKYLLAIVDNGLNITAAAESLYTSQPGVSKQLKLLEEELGMQLFVRKGKSLDEITAGGYQVIERARIIMQEAENIRVLAKNFDPNEQGTISIAATPTQASCVLPTIISKLQQRFPQVRVNVHEGTTQQIDEMLAAGSVDYAIASGIRQQSDETLSVPAFRWHRTILVPKGHELKARGDAITLTDIAKYPLVSYTFGFDHQSALQQAFAKEGLEPNVVFPAKDTEVISTYVRMGLGIGIVAKIGLPMDGQQDLEFIDGSELLPSSTTWIAYRKNTQLNRFSAEFLRLFVAHLSDTQLREVTKAETQRDIDALLTSVVLPVRGQCDAGVTVAA